MFSSSKNVIIAATMASIVLSLLQPLVTLAAPLDKRAKLSSKFAKKLKKGVKNLAEVTDSLVTGDHIVPFESFATFSSIAYCVVDGWKCGPYCDSYPDTKVYKTFDPFFGSDQAGYIAYAPSVKSIIVAFRGSLSIQNFISDIIFKQTDYPPVKDAKVHMGFYKNFESVQPIITDTLHTAMSEYPDAPIVFTGHSLGGAVAVLSALDMFQKGIITTSNVKIYTYGEPRIGNVVFADYVDNTGLKFFRTTHFDDIIPHLPPKILGYRHHDNEYWIHKDENITTKCVGQEDPQCSVSTGPINSLPSHLLYFKRINYCVYG